MSTLVIQSKSKNNLKLIGELAKKIGEDVTYLSKEQVEDLAFGTYMNKVCTGKKVSPETIMKKLASIK
jgi:hypothetical protein